jgi:bifunctional enzyme CysN/CysC
MPERGHFVIWLTGLSGAGKSTIATLLEDELREAGRRVFNLDGDVLRRGLNRDLGYSLDDRHENVRRIAEVARILLLADTSVIVSAISPIAEVRAFARSIVPEGHFIEVFVDAPLEVAEARDTKGLYQRARSGQLANFTGIDSPYEPPASPDVRVASSLLTPQESVAKVMKVLEERFRNLAAS